MILPRYLLRVFSPLFFICLTVFVSVLLMNHFVRLFHLAISKGIPFFWVIKCFGYLMPSLLSMAIPMAFLVALLVALGQLSEDGEVMALRASGYSFWGILWPFMAVGAFLSLVLMFLNHVEGPSGFYRFKNARALAIEQVSRLEVEPRTFLTLGEWKLYARGVKKGAAAKDRESGDLEAPLLFRYKDSDLALRVHAKRGAYRIERGRGLELTFVSGELQKSDLQDPRKLLVADFKKYTVFIPAVGPTQIQREPTMQEMKSSAILAVLRQTELPVWRRAELKTELTVRSVLALAPLAFFWIGCALGVKIEKRGRAWGFALSLMVIFLYYGLFVFGISMGRRYADWSSFIPWMADAVVLMGGLYLWRRNLCW